MAEHQKRAGTLLISSIMGARDRSFRKLRSVTIRQVRTARKHMTGFAKISQELSKKPSRFARITERPTCSAQPSAISGIPPKSLIFKANVSRFRVHIPRAGAYGAILPDYSVWRRSASSCTAVPERNRRILRLCLPGDAVVFSVMAGTTPEGAMLPIEKYRGDGARSAGTECDRISHCA